MSYVTTADAAGGLSKSGKKGSVKQIWLSAVLNG